LTGPSAKRSWISEEPAVTELGTSGMNEVSHG
jgi:hypothetical protein